MNIIHIAAEGAAYFEGYSPEEQVALGKFLLGVCAVLLIIGGIMCIVNGIKTYRENTDYRKWKKESKKKKKK